jgi:hypothetical protein
MNPFENYTFENTQPIFTNVNTTVRVVDIYDGDTCTVVIKFDNNYFKHPTNKKTKKQAFICAHSLLI